MISHEDVSEVKAGDIIMIRIPNANDKEPDIVGCLCYIIGVNHFNDPEPHELCTIRVYSSFKIILLDDVFDRVEVVTPRQRPSRDRGARYRLMEGFKKKKPSNPSMCSLVYERYFTGVEAHPTIDSFSVAIDNVQKIIGTDVRTIIWSCRAEQCTLIKGMTDDA